MNSTIYLLLSRVINNLPIQITLILTTAIALGLIIYFSVKLTIKIKAYFNSLITKVEHTKIEEDNEEFIEEKIDCKIKESNIENHREFLEKIEKINLDLNKYVLRDEFNEKIEDIHEETNFLADKIDIIDSKLNDIEIRLGDKIVESERRQTDNITDNIRQMFNMWASFVSSGKTKDN